MRAERDESPLASGAQGSLLAAMLAAAGRQQDASLPLATLPLAVARCISWLGSRAFPPGREAHPPKSCAGFPLALALLGCGEPLALNNGAAKRGFGEKGET